MNKYPYWDNVPDDSAEALVRSVAHNAIRSGIAAMSSLQDEFSELIEFATKAVEERRKGWIEPRKRAMESHTTFTVAPLSGVSFSSGQFSTRQIENALQLLVDEHLKRRNDSLKDDVHEQDAQEKQALSDELRAEFDAEKERLRQEMHEQHAREKEALGDELRVEFDAEKERLWRELHEQYNQEKQALNDELRAEFDAEKERLRQELHEQHAQEKEALGVELRAEFDAQTEQILESFVEMFDDQREIDRREGFHAMVYETEPSKPPKEFAEVRIAGPCPRSTPPLSGSYAHYCRKLQIRKTIHQVAPMRCELPVRYERGGFDGANDEYPKIVVYAGHLNGKLSGVCRILSQMNQVSFRPLDEITMIEVLDEFPNGGKPQVWPK